VTKPKTYRTKTGRVLSDQDIEVIASDVESDDFDVVELKARRRGRPSMGTGPADVVPVRLDPELRQAVEERASEDKTTKSEVIRRALRDFLHVG